MTVLLLPHVLSSWFFIITRTTYCKVEVSCLSVTPVPEIDIRVEKYISVLVLIFFKSFCKICLF